MIPCGCKGCDQVGKWAPKIMVPATGVPIDAHQPIGMLMNIVVCDAHIADFKADNFVGPEISKQPGNLRQVVEILAAGRAAPDFDRAFVQRVSVDSEEYRLYAAALSGAGTRQ